MKNRASMFLKQLFTVVVTMVKTKTMAVKSKTNAFKTRMLIFRLLQNKKVLMKAINHKIHALMGQERGQGGARGGEDMSKAIVLCNAAPDEAMQTPARTESVECAAEEYEEEEEEEEEEEDDDYPDLTHSLFDLEDDDDGLGNTTVSVIDLVRNSKEDGSEFILEDEIDHVADVFIKRFHRQMKMQKLESFKRYQEMLQRSVQ